MLYSPFVAIERSELDILGALAQGLLMGAIFKAMPPNRSRAVLFVAITSVVVSCYVPFSFLDSRFLFPFQQDSFGYILTLVVGIFAGSFVHTRNSKYLGGLIVTFVVITVIYILFRYLDYFIWQWPRIVALRPLIVPAEELFLTAMAFGLLWLALKRWGALISNSSVHRLSSRWGLTILVFSLFWLWLSVYFPYNFRISPVLLLLIGILSLAALVLLCFFAFPSNPRTLALVLGLAVPLLVFTQETDSTLMRLISAAIIGYYLRELNIITLPNPRSYFTTLAWIGGWYFLFKIMFILYIDQRSGMDEYISANWRHLVGTSTGLAIGVSLGVFNSQNETAKTQAAVE